MTSRPAGETGAVHHLAEYVRDLAERGAPLLLVPLAELDTAGDAPKGVATTRGRE